MANDIVDALSTSLIGINKKSMNEYIEFVANKLMAMLHQPPLFAGTTNPVSKTYRRLYSQRIDC